MEGAHDRLFFNMVIGCLCHVRSLTDVFVCVRAVKGAHESTPFTACGEGLSVFKSSLKYKIVNE